MLRWKEEKRTRISTSSFRSDRESSQLALKKTSSRNDLNPRILRSEEWQKAEQYGFNLFLYRRARRLLLFLHGGEETAVADNEHAHPSNLREVS